MHLPSSLGSSCNFPSGDGSRWIPQAQACERKARWAPAARTPDRRLGRSIRHCSLLLFPSTLVLSTPVFRARISSIPMLSPVHSAKRTRLFRRANPSCVSRLHNRTHSVSIQRKNRSSRLIWCLVCGTRYAVRTSRIRHSPHWSHSRLIAVIVRPRSPLRH